MALKINLTFRMVACSKREFPMLEAPCTNYDLSCNAGLQGMDSYVSMLNIIQSAFTLLELALKRLFLFSTPTYRGGPEHSMTKAEHGAILVR